MTSCRYGSDVMVDILTTLGIEMVALNPGATTRGLHESLVHAGHPDTVLSLHENTAVSIAMGYAKTTGQPMAVMLHDIVGLLNGSLGIFNAWMDQVPILILGGSGPADTTVRRPWIDWVHSAKQQSQLVRDYVKWTDEPTSLPAAANALVRAHSIATTFPEGPVYLSLDAGLQEMALGQSDAGVPSYPDVPRYSGVTVPDDELARLAHVLVTAENPVLVADATGRSQAGFDALQILAETLGARVVDLGARHNFPNTHWAYASNVAHKTIGGADAVLVTDPRDTTWALSTTDEVTRAYRWLPPREAHVSVIGANPFITGSFVDREPLPSLVDLVLTADSSVALPRLAEIVRDQVGDRHRDRAAELAAAKPDGGADADQLPTQPSGAITPRVLAHLLWHEVRGGPWQLANGTLNGWIRRAWRIVDWNQSLGRATGGGLGWGPGASIGCALAHRDDDTMVIDVQPEGDLLYSASALWTAAHYRLPLLMVIANNRTYNQDRMHQDTVHTIRNREPRDISTGIDICDPNIDFAKLAQAQGVEAFGPVSAAEDLPAVLARAVATVRNERRPAVVDVVITRDRD